MVVIISTGKINHLGIYGGVAPCCTMHGVQHGRSMVTVLQHCIHIVPPNPRGGDNTEKYCPRPEGPRAIFFRIITSSWIRGYNMDIKYYPDNFQACHKSQYCPGPSVTGPRRKRSQYWPWICALGNTGMASHLGRRPRAILQYWPRAIM